MPSDPAAMRARIRSFIAIDIEGPARAAVEALLARLRATGAEVAWSRPDALHVTLKFLGAVEPDRLVRLRSRLTAAVARQRPFTAALAGVGGFPSLARPRVLWVGVAAPELSALATDVEGACAAEGFAAEERPFHPHLTLGRVRSKDRRARDRAAPPPRAVTELLAAERDTVFGDASVDDVILYRSDLGAGGARHTPLVRFPLAER